ncbi:hypothetical protein LCGC14_1470550 [marine sediment metagenome]|uniref:Uncharacterized protein n=1 Tax=marine sediment metagenome TaxID=412755 RepID=A0A0F9JD46_9ZZZZ
MAITKLDRSAVQVLRDDIDQALKDVADKHGVKITVNGARYRATEGDFKVKVNTIGTNGVVETAKRSSFIALASHHGLDPKWIDREFMHQGIRYKILGLNTRAKRYPVEVLRMDMGTAYKFPLKLVRECMEEMLSV